MVQLNSDVVACVNSGQMLNGTIIETYLEELVENNQPGNHRVAAVGTFFFHHHFDKGQSTSPLEDI